MSNLPIKMGIGLLIEDDAFNIVRDLQLTVSRTANNVNGLKQPPHITVKRPQTLNHPSEIDNMFAIVDDIAARHHQVDVTLDSIGNFTDKVMYLGIADTTELKQIHQQIAHSLTAQTTEQPIFHATLAHGLTADQFAVAQKELKYIQAELPLKISLKKIGCFMEVDGHWVVVHIKELGSKT